MKSLWNFLNYFVFLYPLYMSFAWTIGALLFYFRRERKPLPLLSEYPFFSIVIPAHNEEKIIEQTIENLKDLDYSGGYGVVVVNDGSSDNTAGILDKLLTKYPQWFRVVQMVPNCGKARATNAGIVFTKGQFILVIDADCLLAKDALKYMAWHFVSFPRVGAVTGNPRILNRTSLLGKIQVGEYSSIIGLIKRSQRILGKLLTVSGVIAAYRKSALSDCGFFDADTVTEDIDMTWKLQKKFWDVRYEPRALGWILAPETIRGLWRQRIRWAQGGVEVIKKHCNIWLDWKQRRFWLVYVEYVCAICWAFGLGGLILLRLTNYLLYSWGIIHGERQSLILVAWTGSILASVCLLQTLTSLYIDYHYEDKKLLKYYFWVIWYPFFYWLISAVTVFFGVFNVLIGKEKVSCRWESPDRGLHIPK